MAKSQTHYVCQECGHQSAQWLGKCPSCQNWNTLVEEAKEGLTAADGRRGSVSDEKLKKISESKSSGSGTAKSSKPQRIRDLGTQKEVRWTTGLGELDRVLGGGMVEGSFLLLGGDPGIGKSTLLLQAL